MTRPSLLAAALAACIGLATSSAQSQALGTAFTYQGELQEAGTPADGSYDFQFRLFNAPGGGAQIGPTVDGLGVQVRGGLFSLPLDFGAGQFAGDAQWLEIAVRPAGGGAFTLLDPRTPINATPYALAAAVTLSDSVTGDSIVAGSVGSAQINATQVQARVSGSCPAGQLMRAVNQNGSVVCAADGVGSSGWALGGNAGVNPATQFLGTTDASPLELRVNGQRRLRLESGPATATTNLIAGGTANSVTTGVSGATLFGGSSSINANTVTDDFGTVGGGFSNRAGDATGAVNSAQAATVGGGNQNVASGSFASVAGGLRNAATGFGASVIGGSNNQALGEVSAVLGGATNCAGGDRSVAMGSNAKIRRGTGTAAGNSGGCTGVASVDANGDEGTFVWADTSVGGDFVSTGPNQFLIRAAGGMAINTNAPRAPLTVTTQNQWNPTVGNGWGDFTVGDGTRGLAVGVSTGGAGAGSVRLWAKGGVENISFTNASLHPAELLHIGASGRVGVGRIAAANAFEVDGNASKSTAGDWLSNSDARIKTEVAEIDSPLERLLRLRPVTFRYTEAYLAERPAIDDVEYYNVIAQEYAEVFPDAVKPSGEYLPGQAETPENAVLQVDFHPASVLTVAAVQELAVRLAELERQSAARISALEAENAALSERLASIEARQAP